jgi:hypothetical protein
MSFYLVGIELRKPREYKSLQDQLNLWGALPLTRAAWLVEHPGTAVNVRKDLQAFVDAEDTVFAVQLKPGIEWSGWVVPKNANDWLSLHFPTAF